MAKTYYIVATGYGYCIYCNGNPIEGTERVRLEECELLLCEIKG